MTIDTKLTTIEQIQSLLDFGAVLILRKRGDVVDCSSAKVWNDAEMIDANRQSLESVLCEGVDSDIEYVLESATSRTLSDAVRNVAAFNDLPY